MNKSLPSAPVNDKSVLPSNLSFPVVGIGASAGGIEALSAFCKALPIDIGMAFVIVLHLAPEHESAVAEILQKHTAMPVIKLIQPTPIEINHIYVIPQGKHLTMNDGYLTLGDFDRSIGQRIEIDIFFRTLADVHRERSFGIVLSGAGSDGAVGIMRVKEQGGVTLVQLPSDAAHDSMPLSAIATGAVDFILQAKEMPQKLHALWENARIIKLPPMDESDADTEYRVQEDSSASAEDALQKIITLLRAHTGHDFRHYKRPTVLRRIERRLQVRGMPNLHAYLEILEADASEHAALLRDMLIGVTNFFRDREAFELLESRIMSELIGSKLPNETVRAWVPACSTGEEAYSIAMVLSDQVRLLSKPPKIQVFASDIDERAINTARTAVYPGSIIADVPPERLQQYFTKEEDRYRIRKSVRDCVLFAPHNLLRDPPFSKLDLITCRNLLIYLNREMQAHVLEMFHFSLNPGGFLFLGSSESADLVSHLFAPIDKKNRIYQAKTLSRVRHPPTLPHLPALRQQTADSVPIAGKRQFSFAEVHQRVLAQFAPPSVIVNHDSEIVYMSDRAGRFLRHVGGEPSRNLVSLVHPELRVELRTALFQAERHSRSVEARRVRLTRGEHTYFVNMILRPFHDQDADADFVLVQFDEVEQTMSEEPGIDDSRDDTVLTQLEEELQRTKEQLQETIEQSEISNEELRASNEELQAINEELRSATEELETSKEELQSVNEELSTVNYELKSKVEETGKVNDDLNNLIASADIATIFMDRGMRIKRYTPRVSDIFNIIPSDIGRSLLDITHRLNYPELTADAASTFETLRPMEREVPSIDDRYYIVRLVPYRTTEDHIDGAVMTFFDITMRKEAEERLRAGEERMRLVSESMKDYAIITLDTDGLITSWSKGAERIYGYCEPEVLGQHYGLIFLPQERQAGVPQQEMQKAKAENRVENERWNLRKDGKRFFASGVMTPLSEGNYDGYARIVRDETGRVERETRQEAQLTSEQEGRTSAEMTNSLKDEFIAVISHELRNPLNLIHMNAELLARLVEVQSSALAVKAVGSIRSSVMNQSRVIEDLLDMSRLQTGKLSLSRSTIDLTGVVQDTLAMCRQDPAVFQRRITLAADNAELFVFADRIRLEQVLLNLIGNAVKFTEPQGSIALRLYAENGHAVLEVKDDGRGITPAFLPQVFDMFKQASAGSNRKNSGLGIGLALARQILEQHGGTIEAESEGDGKGACFRMRLPLQSKFAAFAGQAAGKSYTKALDKLRILLIDDDQETLQSFSYLLEIEGASVSRAETVEKALSLLDSEQIDLIVSDLAMPDMDGFALIEKVRQHAVHCSIPAIAVTGLGSRQDVKRALHMGFAAHLAKPVSMDSLCQAIKRLTKPEK